MKRSASSAALVAMGIVQPARLVSTATVTGPTNAFGVAPLQQVIVRLALAKFMRNKNDVN